MIDLVAPIRVRGNVKWWNKAKGFGFIVVEGHNRDIFVHKQQLTRSGIDGDLVEGEPVSLIVMEGQKGMYATQIEKPAPNMGK